MKGRIVVIIHSASGLLLGLFILLISLSGSILVFHEELDRLEYPSVVAHGSKKDLTIDSAYNIVKSQFPRAQISHCDLPEKSGDPFVFSFYDSWYSDGTEPMQLFTHPQTGGILKIRSARKNLVNWIAVMHNDFHLGKTGEWLFGFFSLVLLLSLLTGLILYRKNILAVLTFRKAVFKKGNLHQIIGTWALLFNLMIGITGFWMQRYVFKKDFYKANNYSPVFKPSPSLSFSIDSSLRHSEEEFPGFTGYVIYFAQSTKSKTAIYGSKSSNSFIHSKRFADVIYLDSVGSITKTAFVNEIDASSRYDIINSQVHFGQYGGMAVKILYSLFGLTGGLLALTGSILWFKRIKKRRG